VSVPGHTEGSTLYQLADRAIFTGDTLFLESVVADLATRLSPSRTTSIGAFTNGCCR